MKVHLCIECRKLPPEQRPPTVRKPWNRLRPGDPIRCGEHGRAWRDRNRRRDAESRIRRMGIEPELYWAVYEAQGGRCALPRCTATGKTKLLAIEHNHRIAREECDHPEDRVCVRCLRGLMCGPHNYVLLGKFGNSLQDALDYLADPPARKVIEDYVRRNAVPLQPGAEAEEVA